MTGGFITMCPHKKKEKTEGNKNLFYTNINKFFNVSVTLTPTVMNLNVLISPFEYM